MTKTGAGGILVSTVTRLRDGRPGVRFQAGAGKGLFSFRHSIQTCSGAYPHSYPMFTGGFNLGSKAASASQLITHPQLVPKEKNAWSYTSTPHTIQANGGQQLVKSCDHFLPQRLKFAVYNRSSHKTATSVCN